MKFVQTRPYADPEAAMRKLLEIASTIEPVQDGRIHIEKVNWPMLSEHKAAPAEYRLALTSRSARERHLHEVHPGRCGAVRVMHVDLARNGARLWTVVGHEADCETMDR
jgi:hypothetical protein